MQIFGFEIKKKQKQEEGLKSIIHPDADDGAINLSSSAAAYYSQIIDLEASVKNENELIKKYREISLLPEVDEAITEIINEAISYDENYQVVKLDLSNLKTSDSVKTKILEEFNTILDLLNFKEKCYEIFHKWYVDGRLYYLVNIDPQAPKKGIQSLQRIDSRKIRKVRNLEKTVDKKTGLEVIQKIDEYFIYNEKGISGSSTSGIKLSVDSVVYVPSGLVDENTNIVLSYLHKAIKPANQLKMMEDAVVIYRISRAPERRIFYIDVGNLPKIKAEQYVADIMNKYRSKIVYDASTGEIRDDRKFMSMLEDFWMPRREGGKGTEITTLPGGQNLGQMEDVDYFKQKLYQSLNVPISRLLPNQNFSLGRTTEITRDELRFMKFIDRLRTKFSVLFLECLKIQLIAKNIIALEDWEKIKNYLTIKWTVDNNFTELKQTELYQNRIAVLQAVDQFVGKWFSPQWVQRNILKFTEQEIEQMEKEIDKANAKFLNQDQQNQNQDFATNDNEKEEQNIPENHLKNQKEFKEENNSLIHLEEQKMLSEVELLKTINKYLITK